jgi:hypothetical protein
MREKPACKAEAQRATENKGVAAMTDFLIAPLKGVGNIKFGMVPNEVRSRIGLPYRSFKRSSVSSFPCDHFEQLGVFFYYDSNGTLEAIEMTSRACPTLNSVDLFALDFESATRALAALDASLKSEVDSVISYGLGVSIYAPLAKDNPKAPLESVIAFRAGYFN